MMDESKRAAAATWANKAILTVMIGSLIAVMILFAIIRKDRNILGPYPEQRVVTVSADTVTITGRLCARRTVQVTTELGFQAFTPPYRWPQDSIAGAFVSVASGIQQTRTKGCTVHQGPTAFVNAIPATVRTVDRHLARDHQWRVVGQETVTIHGHLQTAFIRSTPFRLAP